MINLYLFFIIAEKKTLIFTIFIKGEALLFGAIKNG